MSQIHVYLREHISHNRLGDYDQEWHCPVPEGAYIVERWEWADDFSLRRIFQVRELDRGDVTPGDAPGTTRYWITNDYESGFGLVERGKPPGSGYVDLTDEQYADYVLAEERREAWQDRLDAEWQQTRT